MDTAVDRTEGVWRWNVGDVWQTFSSMFQEAVQSRTVRNDISRYHHLSAALLFGGCTLEAFLNSNMRTHAEGSSAKDEVIIKRLRYTSLGEKLKKWPSELVGSDIPLSYVKTITDFLDLRNEVTHRRRKDHSLYLELDEANIQTFVSAVQVAMVSMYAGLKKPFPYWLLGWNYVGFNGDISAPCLLNNQQFRHSLVRFGFDVPAWNYAAAKRWEQTYMTSTSGFSTLQAQVYEKCSVIEPISQRAPHVPRLCKRWWDSTLIQSIEAK